MDHYFRKPLDERDLAVEDPSRNHTDRRLALTQGQRTELDVRLAAYEADGEPGRLVEDVISGIRKRL